MLNSLYRKNYVGGYLRLSKEDFNSDNASESILNQKKLITKFCEENNFIIHDFYIDDGYSGGNFERPAFKRLLKDIDKGVIDTVITKDTSRLGREFIDTSNYIFKYFPEHNVRYIAILENFDTYKPNGMEDIIPFQTVINDMYLKDTSRKIKSVRHQKMKDGLFVGSSVSYGYKRSPDDNRKFVIDEEEAKVVKRIYQMRIDGNNLTQIANILNNEGVESPTVKHKRNVKTAKSGLWTNSSIRTILTNEVYLGHLIQGKFDKISFRSKKKYLKPRSEWIIVKNTHEPIIDEDTFLKVQNIFKESKMYRTSEAPHKLKGLVICGECKKPMTFKMGIYKGERYYVYECRTYQNSYKKECSCHYFREQKLEEYILDATIKLLRDVVNSEKLSIKYDEVKINSNRKADYENTIKSFKERIKVLDKSLKDLYNDKNSEIISINDYNSLKEELINEKKKLEENISDCEYKMGKILIDLKKDTRKSILIKKFIEEPSIEFLKALISKIEIYEDKTVKIYYKFKIGEKNEIGS